MSRSESSLYTIMELAVAALIGGAAGSAASPFAAHLFVPQGDVPPAVCGYVSAHRDALIRNLYCKEKQ